jgi:hypothetical protein
VELELEQRSDDKGLEQQSEDGALMEHGCRRARSRPKGGGATGSASFRAARRGWPHGISACIG